MSCSPEARQPEAGLNGESCPGRCIREGLSLWKMCVQVWSHALLEP